VLDKFKEQREEMRGYMKSLHRSIFGRYFEALMAYAESTLSLRMGGSLAADPLVMKQTLMSGIKSEAGNWIEGQHSEQQQMGIDSGNETMLSAFEFMMALASKYGLLKLPVEADIGTAGIAMLSITTATLVAYERSDFDRAYRLFQHLRAFTLANFEAPGAESCLPHMQDVPPQERNAALQAHLLSQLKNPAQSTGCAVIPIANFVLGMKPAVSEALTQ
jgi:hypothetical protein